MSCEWVRERERRQRRRRVSVGGINDLNCCEYWISFQISAPTLNINSIFVSFCLMASIVLLYLNRYGAPLLKIFSSLKYTFVKMELFKSHGDFSTSSSLFFKLSDYTFFIYCESVFDISMMLMMLNRFFYSIIWVSYRVNKIFIIRRGICRYFKLIKWKN